MYVLYQFEIVCLRGVEMEYVWRVWVRAAWGMRGWGLLDFYEGVKDFVGEDSMVVIRMVAGRVFHVDVKYICSVQVCFFFLVM